MNEYVIGLYIFLLLLWWFKDTFFCDYFVQKVKRINDRKAALLKAKVFLRPYKKLFGDLYLSNSSCTVSYLSGNMIFAVEKTSSKGSSKRSIFAQNFKLILTIDEFWNKLCKEFDYSTQFDEIIVSCRSYASKVDESSIKNIKSNENNSEIPVELKSTNVYMKNELIDINTCSEAEFKALPGVSIVTAKKIIKARDENGSFASVEDFLATIALKPHFATQIESLIFASKVEVKKKNRIRLERVLDI